MTGNAERIVMYLMGQDRNLLWDLSPHKEKRSLNANSYYWSLLNQVARKLKISSSRLHNQMLRDVSITEMVGDQVVTVYLPDTDDAEKQVAEATTYHLKPTSRVRDGRRCYVMLRGSHTFNTEEMSHLIDLMVTEAQAQGIDTMTPAEIEHMMEMEKQHEKRSGKHCDGFEKT